MLDTSEKESKDEHQAADRRVPERHDGDRLERHTETVTDETLFNRDSSVARGAFARVAPSHGNAQEKHTQFFNRLQIALLPFPRLCRRFPVP